MWNFSKLRMEFTIMGHKVALRGIKSPAAGVIQQEKMEKLLAKPIELCMISVGIFQERQDQEGMGTLLTMEGDQGSIVDKEDLQVILQAYQDLLEVPTELPPSRLHDHKITLKEGVSPINIRPYRYPAIQKDELKSWWVKCCLG